MVMTFFSFFYLHVFNISFTSVIYYKDYLNNICTCFYPHDYERTCTYSYVIVQGNIVLVLYYMMTDEYVCNCSYITC